ncbi:hypothetical protein SG34_030045 [Thalassomonas viridans]|uniref:Uncharacterized protein n=1 Tax=Thalassomonas viridans TaxID=137584 RepID=A0AAE9Z976_9GAMM|nr:hypothetical protein [Thalassomonas viridans]WDE09021.1 hypothetical protein SG34_030045 [Thalassomonas viridans]
MPENNVQSLMDKIVGAVDDFATITVNSYTGNISGTVKDEAKGKIDFKKLFAESDKEGSTLKLVMSSEYSLDGDANLYRDNSQELSPEIKAAHDEAVQTAREMKADLIKLIFEAVKN